MATATQKQQISENQYRYLTNLAAGKTPTGGQANPGQIKWAKAQLAKSVYTPPKPAPATPPIRATTTTTTQARTPPVSTSNVPSSQPTVNTMAPPVVNQRFSPPQQPPSWDERTRELFNRFEQLVNTPFTYNPETDPRYQAQRQLAQQRAQEASRQALEAMNERGLLSSSLTATQLGQIQQQAEQEALSYIPQYEALARQDYQNRLRAAADLLRSAMDIGDREFNRAVTEAELTGSYLPPQARGLINNLLDLKRQAEAPGITREARAELSRQADVIRSQLQGMGIDPSLFGADVTSAQAQQNIGRAGIQTLEAQQFAYQQARDKIADERYKQEFDEDVRRFNLQYALEKAVRNRQLSQEDARIALERAQLAQRQREYELDVQREQRLREQAASTPTRTAEEVRTYLDSMAQRDPNTGQITNIRQLEEAILLSGLSDYETYRLYQRYGIPWNGPIPTP